ncbi:hypothetical protein Asi02nite_49340 [Asanoa siamensis]|uniref:Uncharacterized protein n=1 Tax=Asanoa siamensis TaxID=926357 RepID=A0ABQ4CVU6_9ACTN|nr:hypothetical protein Asi02nite_49340 [Asanoa siamensis]
MSNSTAAGRRESSSKSVIRTSIARTGARSGIPARAGGAGHAPGLAIRPPFTAAFAVVRDADNGDGGAAVKD